MTEKQRILLSVSSTLMQGILSQGPITIDHAAEQAVLYAKALIHEVESDHNRKYEPAKINYDSLAESAMRKNNQ